MADAAAPVAAAKKPAEPKHKIEIVQSLMTSEYEKNAVQVSIQAVEKYRLYKDMATFIKKEYDKLYPSTGKSTDGVYHCICGAHFAASVSHETRSYIHLKVDLNHIIIFKSKDSPFDVDQGTIGS